MTKAVNVASKTVEDIRHADQRTKAEQVRLEAHDKSAIDAQAVTAETISEAVRAAVGALAAAFYEPEQRVRGLNGRLYPMGQLGAAETAFDEATGEEYTEVVNRFAFLQRDLASVLPWKLENMLERSADRIAEQRKRIAQAVRQLDSGRTDPGMIERLADFLETLIEQQAMVQVAFDAALDGYEAAVGEAYETKAMRADRERQVRRQAPKNDLDARLQRLGVTR